MTELPLVVRMTVDNSQTDYALSVESNSHEIGLRNETEIVVGDSPIYEGSYTVTPSTSQQVLDTDGKLCTDDIVVNAVPSYTGTYTVTASTLGNIVLQTNGKLMSDNVTVNGLTQQNASSPTIALNTSTGVITAYADYPVGYNNSAYTDTDTYSLPTQAGTTITPTTSQQVAVARGKYTLGAVNVGAIPSQYADITGTTAQASDVLAGKYFVNSSGVLTLGTGGGGMDSETKDALLECFEHVAWVDTDGQIYYNNLLNALYPLQSISAVYTGGTVAPSTPLDDLKSDLVVTATFEDGTVKTVTNYTLSGTLTVGTSTITVTYFTETTTFNVTVSAGYVYYDYLQGDGTAFIDTGLLGKTYAGDGYIKYVKLQIVDSVVDKTIFGIRNQWGTTGVQACSGSAGFAVAFGNKWTTITGKGSGDMLELELNYPNINVAGTLYATVTNATPSINSTSTTISLFGGTTSSRPTSGTYATRNSGYVNQFSQHKLYRFTLTEKSTGTVIADMKPATYQGVAGLYDSVRDMFFTNVNSSGSFTIGNDGV